MMNTSNYLVQNLEKFGDEAALSVKDSNGQWKTDTWNDFYIFLSFVFYAIILA